MVIESYPCPKCGEHCLIYEGMLVWRSGPRPPRRLARKHIAFSARADYERERLYRCEQCGAEFFQDVEQRSAHLYEEHVGGQYHYNSAWGAWEWRRFDPAKRQWTVRRLEPHKGREWKPRGAGWLAKRVQTALSLLAGGGEEYIVQEHDSLRALADRFYGEPSAWPAIWRATNQKFLADGSFAVVVEPDALKAEQKLWIPNARQARQGSMDAEGWIASVFFARSGGELVLRGKSGRSGQLPPVDGLSGPTWHVLRFYQDGLILTATIHVQDLAQSWPQIKRWFHRDTTNRGCASGQYRRIGDCLSFFETLEQGKALYAGIYSEEKIQLRSKRGELREYLRLDAASVPN